MFLIVGNPMTKSLIARAYKSYKRIGERIVGLGVMKVELKVRSNAQ